jgi:hypothetical protein
MRAKQEKNMVQLMMHHGRLLDVFDLKKEDIDIEVIIRGATRINRFLGQTRYVYPVASHLIGGWKYLDDIGADILLKKQWLIHEAFESYTGVDLASPLKAQWPAYKEAEKKALKLIAEILGFSPAESAAVKKLDDSIMVAEALVLTKNRAYWKEYAQKKGIEPLSDRYVLEYLDEARLRTLLENMWEKTFGDNS